MDKRRRPAPLTEVITGWEVKRDRMEQFIPEVTAALSTWMHEQTDGDHNVAIEALLNLACLIAIAGEIDPQELRDRFGRILSGYTKSVVIAFPLTPGGDA